MLTVDLDQKVALVTGATGELGRAIALKLAQCGADVAIHYKENATKAEELVQAVHETGRRAVPVQADVGNRDSVMALHDAVVSALGAPDIVVTNAVQQVYPWQTVLEESVEDYESQFRSCVLQNVMMAKAFAPAMIEAGWGRIIGISTECAMQCWARQSAYASGKRGMDGVLRHRSGFLEGILNGIDTEHWNPATEESLPVRFSADDLSGKAVCREHLLEQLGMDAEDPRLVVGMLGRMTAQKGWRLLLGAMPLLIKDGVRVILMGSGNPEYEDQIRRFVERYPQRVAYRPGYDETFARLLYAGSDALAVPSFFEPCGLVQMYAQRFGTVPIGHKTGGLADTIVDPDHPAGRRPTGFLFSPATPTGLAIAIRRAERVFRRSPEEWMALCDNAMRCDFSWHKSAARYVETYQTALDTRRSEARRSRA